VNDPVAAYHALLDDERLTGDSAEALTEGQRARQLMFGERPLCVAIRPQILTRPRYEQAVSAAQGIYSALSSLEKAVLKDDELRRVFDVNFFGGVPTMYLALLNYPEADQYDLSGLQWCVSGGAPMPVEIMRAFDEKYRVNILEGYGLSETSPVASFSARDRPKKVGSIGLPIWGVEFRLVDDEGNVIEAPGTPGEIQIKGHNVMKGYWKRPEATAEALKNGWFATGDIATRDADGYYFIVDRKKDLIIRGGFNIYPRDVEETLYANPKVAEAAVVGMPDPVMGEEVLAFVVIKPGEAATPEELIAFCQARLARFKSPREVRIVPSLPKSPIGKILRKDLRREAHTPS